MLHQRTVFAGFAEHVAGISRYLSAFEQLSCLKSPKRRESYVHDWFERYKSDMQCWGRSALALLSCLFPEKRADRVYGMRAQQLEDIITKAACSSDGVDTVYFDDRLQLG
jgi:hypothetical protein